MTALTLPVALAALSVAFAAAAALTAAASLRAHGYLTVREVTCLVICIGTVVVVFWFG